MRFLLLFIIAFFSFSSIYSQELIVDSGVVLKKGVYKTFEEFKYNSPSLDYTEPLETRFDSYGGFRSKNKMTYYGIGKELEGGIKTKNVFGFSDGEKAYINIPSLSLSSKDFIELELFGKYCYYRFINKNSTYMTNYGAIGGAVGGASVVLVGGGGNLVEILIDINDGAYYTANVKTFKSLFPNENIRQDLKLSKNRNFRFRPLLEEYMQRIDYDINRMEFLEEDSLNVFLVRLPKDSTVEEYFKRLEGFKRDSRIKEIKFIRNEYKNGNPKTLGVWASHKMGNNSDYLYDIGTWYHYHKNGQLAEIINYNLTGKKHGAYIKYNDEGNVIEELEYENGELVTK